MVEYKDESTSFIPTGDVVARPEDKTAPRSDNAVVGPRFDHSVVERLKAIGGLNDAQKREIDEIVGRVSTLDPHAPGGPAEDAPPDVKPS